MDYEFSIAFFAILLITIAVLMIIDLARRIFEYFILRKEVNRIKEKLGEMGEVKGFVEATPEDLTFECPKCGSKMIAVKLSNLDNK